MGQVVKLLLGVLHHSGMFAFSLGFSASDVVPAHHTMGGKR